MSETDQRTQDRTAITEMIVAFEAYQTWHAMATLSHMCRRYDPDSFAMKALELAVEMVDAEKCHPAAVKKIVSLCAREIVA